MKIILGKDNIIEISHSEIWNLMKKYNLSEEDAIQILLKDKMKERKKND